MLKRPKWEHIIKYSILSIPSHPIPFYSILFYSILLKSQSRHVLLYKKHYTRTCFDTTASISIYNNFRRQQPILDIDVHPAIFFNHFFCSIFAKMFITFMYTNKASIRRNIILGYVNISCI